VVISLPQASLPVHKAYIKHNGLPNSRSTISSSSSVYQAAPSSVKKPRLIIMPAPLPILFILALASLVSCDYWSTLPDCAVRIFTLQMRYPSADESTQRQCLSQGFSNTIQSCNNNIPALCLYELCDLRRDSDLLAYVSSCLQNTTDTSTDFDLCTDGYFFGSIMQTYVESELCNPASNESIVFEVVNVTQTSVLSIYTRSATLRPQVSRNMPWTRGLADI
jgi:hypothetical protein